MANTTATSIGRPTKAKASRISGVDPWRTLEALSFYRAAACIALLALASSNYRPPYFQGPNGTLIDASLFVGLFVCALFLVLVRGEWPHWRWQAGLQIGTDIAYLVFLNYASGGIASGIATLLVTPVAAGSLLLDRRLAAAPAAIATIALLLSELYLNVQGASEQKLSQAGMLGAGLFIIALSGSALARRARESENKAQRAMSDLSKLAALSESVIHKLQAGVLVCSASGEVELLNRAGKRLLGPELMKGASIRAAAPALWQRFQHWQADPATLTTSAIQIKDGSQAWVQFTRLGSGNDTSTLIVLDDASRVAEQAISMKLAALGRLTASIAHEIRNPLSAIQHAAELATETPNRSDADQQLLAIIRRQSQRLGDIVNNVLSLSRPNIEPTRAIRTDHLLAQAIKVFREAHPGSTLAITTEVTPSSSAIFVDAAQFTQIFQNLLENAHTHGGNENQTEVSIQAHLNGPQNELVIDMRDNGPGISEAVAAHIFEPFFSTHHQGTGLGLFITRELCTAANGTLKVLPSASGAHFRVTFPAALNPA